MIDAKNSASVYHHKLNFGDRVLGDAERITIALQQEGHSGLVPSKLCIPTREVLVRSFRVAVGQGQGQDC